MKKLEKTHKKINKYLWEKEKAIKKKLEKELDIAPIASIIFFITIILWIFLGGWIWGLIAALAGFAWATRKLEQ